jgi:hypothetical protein
MTPVPGRLPAEAESQLQALKRELFGPKAEKLTKQQREQLEQLREDSRGKNSVLCIRPPSIRPRVFSPFQEVRGCVAAERGIGGRRLTAI